MYKRSEYQVITSRLKEPRMFIQFVMGRKEWGRIFESGIGAWIVNQAFVHRIEVFYWRELANEVDFILRKKGTVVAIEV